MHSGKPKLVKPTPDPVSPVETSPADAEVNRVATPTTRLSGWQDRRVSYQTLLFLTAGVAYLMYITFRPFLKAVFVALIMAIIFFPLHKRFGRMFRNTNIAALFTTVLAILLILVPFVLSSTSGSRLKPQISTVQFCSRWVTRQLGSKLDPVMLKAAETIGTPPEQLKAEIEIRAREAGKRVLAVVASFGQRFLGAMATIAVASIFLFSLLRRSDEFRLGALSMLPLSPNRAHELAVAVNEKVIADIYGGLRGARRVNHDRAWILDGWAKFTAGLGKCRRGPVLSAARWCLASVGTRLRPVGIARALDERGPTSNLVRRYYIDL